MKWQIARHVERHNFLKLFDDRSSFWSRTVSIAACKTSKVLHVTIYVKAKRVVAHNRYLFPTCLIASNYFTGACQRHRSIHGNDGGKPAVRLHIAPYLLNLSIMKKYSSVAIRYFLMFSRFNTRDSDKTLNSTRTYFFFLFFFFLFRRILKTKK